MDVAEALDRCARARRPGGSSGTGNAAQTVAVQEFAGGHEIRIRMSRAEAGARGPGRVIILESDNADL